MGEIVKALEILAAELLKERRAERSMSPVGTIVSCLTVTTSQLGPPLNVLTQLRHHSPVGLRLALQ